ncbi:YcgJ family protein [Citrobacter portucalensis]|uniref:YcgJ family protein n=1 Tax=Citrobacter portucalensis TaxID=1639133 RepID=UPI001BAC4015|nr:YcgJ family protein [Citrobacter portucalensis]
MMIKVGTLLALSILSLSAYAATTGLNSPAPGVLCDKTICADEHGLSVALTTKYLGKQQAEILAAAGQFDTSAFTFRGGLFCDTNERLCRDDRYFGTDGKRSGKINTHYTALLFGRVDKP